MCGGRAYGGAPVCAPRSLHPLRAVGDGAEAVVRAAERRVEQRRVLAIDRLAVAGVRDAARRVINVPRIKLRQCTHRV